jgi:hypothetical protein
MNRWKNGTLQRIRNSDEFSLRIVEELEKVEINPYNGSILGFETLEERVRYLNENGITRRGGEWDRSGVRRVLLRVEKIRKEKK